MKIKLRPGAEHTPVATFNYGNSHVIIVSDCYGLVTKSSDGLYDTYAWVSPELHEILKRLPNLPKVPPPPGPTNP
jgi:hypothetical protein